MFGSFQTSNHQWRIAEGPKRGSAASCSRKPRTSLFQFSKDAGGKVGTLDTADGKKLNTTNGVKPREVNASMALNVTEKSIGLAGSGQTIPLSAGSMCSRVPLFREPKKRTPLNAIGEAAMLSRRR